MTNIAPPGRNRLSEGPPPDYRFDAYAKGGIDSFTVTPDETLVPVPASSTETETFTATTNAKWTWNQTMPGSPGSFSANETSGNNNTYDAYCTHAGSYTLQAEKHDDDKITALATYIPTGVQRLYAKQADNASNWEQAEQSLPIQGGATNSDVPVLYVPYTEDENEESTTIVTLKAFACPTSDFPDGFPVWKMDGQSLDANGETRLTGTLRSPQRVYEFSATCGNTLKIKIVTLQVQISPTIPTIMNCTESDDSGVFTATLYPTEFSDNVASYEWMTEGAYPETAVFPTYQREGKPHLDFSNPTGASTSVKETRWHAPTGSQWAAEDGPVVQYNLNCKIKIGKATIKAWDTHKGALAVDVTGKDGIRGQVKRPEVKGDPVLSQRDDGMWHLEKGDLERTEPAKEVFLPEVDPMSRTTRNKS